MKLKWWHWATLGLIFISLGVVIMLPIFSKESPFIEFLRDENGKLLAVGDSPSGEIIVGDTVYWSNQYGNLSVTPHTGQGITDHKQNFNLLWKYPDNTIDIAFRFDFALDTNKSDLLLYQNVSRNITVCDNYFNETTQEIDEFNCTNKTIYYMDFVSKKHLIQHSFYNGKHYYFLKNVPVKQNQNYERIIKYNTPIHTNGKWDLLAKLSSETIQQALSSGHYIMIDPYWGDGNWPYLKLCNISNNYQDYQIRITVGNSSGGDVHCEGNAQSDFDDIRFVYDNTTELPFWRENYTADTQATFWINNTVNASQIQMYYGNDDVTTTSNGTDTFIAWDDFDLGYNDNDPPKTSRGWVVTDGGGSDVCEIDATPPAGAVGYALEYQEDGGGSLTIADNVFSQIDDQPVMIHYDFYYETRAYQSAMVVRDDVSNAITTIRTATDNSRFRYYYSLAYNDFSPQQDCAVDTWYDLRWFVYPITDDFDLSRDEATEGDGRLRTVMSSGDNLEDVRLYGTTSGTDWFFFDNFYICNYTYNTQPSWSGFGNEIQIGFDTYVDTITPYDQGTTETVALTATSDGLAPGNIILWYRWSNDNSSWNGGILSGSFTNNTVDDFNQSIDGVDDVGNETLPGACQDFIPDADVMTIQENNTATGGSSEWRYVVSTSSDILDWSEFGANPWIDAQDGFNWIRTKTAGQDERWFNFSDTTKTGTLTVNLSVYSMVEFPNTCNWYIDTTGDDTEEFSGSYVTMSASTWENTATISGLDTVAEVDAARLWLEYEDSPIGADWCKLDAARLGVATSGTADYELDLEYNWTGVNKSKDVEQLCFYLTGSVSENLDVDYSYDGSWTNLGTITSTGWTNFTIDLLYDDYAIRLNDSESDDDGTQTSWTIDVIKLYTYDYGGPNGWNWTNWRHASNPDGDSPWMWNFTCPNGTGYYEFYSIGNESGYDNESAPDEADAGCYLVYGSEGPEWQQTWLNTFSFSNDTVSFRQSWLNTFSFSNDTVSFRQPWLNTFSFSNDTVSFRQSWLNTFSFSNDTSFRQTWLNVFSFSNDTVSFRQPWLNVFSFSNDTSFRQTWLNTFSFSNDANFIQTWINTFSFSNDSIRQWQQPWLNTFSFSNDTSFRQTWLNIFSFSNDTNYQQTWLNTFSFSNDSIQQWFQTWINIFSFSNDTSFRQTWLNTFSFSNDTVSFRQTWLNTFSFSNDISFRQPWINTFSFSNDTNYRQIWLNTFSFSNDTFQGWEQVWLNIFSFSNTTPFRQTWLNTFSFSNDTVSFRQPWLNIFSFSNDTVSDRQTWINTFSFSNDSIEQWQQTWVNIFSFSNDTVSFRQPWLNVFSFSNDTVSYRQTWLNTFSFSNDVSHNQVWISTFSFSNTTAQNQIWINTFSFSNDSIAAIIVSNVYPINHTVTVNLQPFMYATFNNTYGRQMNVSWYYGSQGAENNLFETDTNFANSTQTVHNHIASARATNYYWRIHVNDGTIHENYTYHFKTEGFAPGGGTSAPQSSIGAIGIIGILGIIGLLVYLRKKSKEDEL